MNVEPTRVFQPYNAPPIAKKDWWKSKTLWLNLIAGIIAILDQDVMPTNYSVTALAVMNVILRLLTGMPIAMPKTLQKALRSCH